MKTADQYLRFVRWSDEDNLYVGYCADLFPWGGVCHGSDEHTTYRELDEIIAQEVSDLEAAGKELPPAVTRPMREAIGA
jgi:hypothetical protein